MGVVLKIPPMPSKRDMYKCSHIIQSAPTLSDWSFMGHHGWNYGFNCSYYPARPKSLGFLKLHIFQALAA